jgi:hypothetical protein
MAPVVQEIAWRSHSPGELVLRRLLSGDRREEIFLPKSELKQKIEALQESNRALFDPLFASAAPTAPAAAPAKAASNDAHPIAATPPQAQTIRHRAGTPSLGTPPLGISASTPPPTVVKSVGDAPKPALDTPAGDVLRRTLIGATVESALQNAAAVTTGAPPAPPPVPAAQAVSVTPPPPESVSKTPLANPSHLDTLRKEAAGTIDAKHVGTAAKG